MRKKITRALRRMTRVLAAALLGTALGAGQCLAAAFPDVPSGAWYGGMLEGALGRGIIRGYEDGTFRPDAELSYGEFLAMLSGQRKSEYSGYGHWAAGHYAYALERGWLSEGSVPVRRLSEPIPRRHMARIAAGAAEAEGLALTVSSAPVPLYLYSDVGSADREEYHISLCSRLGILSGYGDGTFRPDAFLRRCEALKVVTVFEELKAACAAGAGQGGAQAGGAQYQSGGTQAQGSGSQAPIVSVLIEEADGPAENDPLMELLLETARSTRCRREGESFVISYEQPEIPAEWYFEYHFLLYGSEAEDYEQLLWYDSEYATPDYSEAYDPSAHSVTRTLKGVRSLDGREFVIQLFAYDRSEGKGSCRELVMSWSDGGAHAEKIWNGPGGKIRVPAGAGDPELSEVFLW